MTRNRSTTDIRSRRGFLAQTGLGFGAVALGGMLEQDSSASPVGVVRDQSPRQGHFPGQAKSVIMLFQNGGPSQMDLFEPKPELQRRGGQTVEGILGGDGNTPSTEPLKASSFKFKKHGQSGIAFSELVPHMGGVVDELCVVRSMVSIDPNHPGATYMMCSCNNRPGRPTVGAWTVYALGSENQNLPGYVLLRDPGIFHSGGGMQITNGWLPAQFRGTELRAEGEPILNLRPGQARPDGILENNLSMLDKLNRRHQRYHPDETILESRIQNFELAARMQLRAARELDLSGETAATEKMYGIDDPATAPYGRQLLLARRLVERGVRFVQVLSPGPHNVWDHHGGLDQGLPAICAKTDLPSAGLIKDLKQRGLLDETIVIWTGEFGRLPTSQGGSGRDHNPRGFTTIVAGGGLKGGYAHGATDDLGYASVVDPVSVPDLFATVLNQLGLDHERVTYNVHGLEENVTDTRVYNARVVREMLA